jgi:CPA2 family monovalent cation:H+ antiporter-2
MLLSQGGEFAFVLLGAAVAARVVEPELGQLLVVTVALTMMATPLLAVLGRKVERRVERSTVVHIEQIPEATRALERHVVIAGFGRVGAAVASQLGAAGIPVVAVDTDPHRVARAQQRGLPAYYGDATRAEILDALGVERARAIVVALDNPRAALQLVALLCYIFPDLKIYARARDDTHAAELERAGAHIVVPELVATGVKLAGSILDRVAPADRPDRAAGS